MSDVCDNKSAQLMHIIYIYYILKTFLLFLLMFFGKICVNK